MSNLLRAIPYGALFQKEWLFCFFYPDRVYAELRYEEDLSDPWTFEETSP